LLETPKALDTIIIKIKTHKNKKTNLRNKKTNFVLVLLVKILMDVTMDNQQETKNFILFKFKSNN
jgi:hypothetical protein